MHIQQYIPTEGIIVFSETGFQRVTSISGAGFNFYSPANNTIIIDNKFCADSCWETSNIFYIDKTTSYVKKISYDGTLLSSKYFFGLSALSVIQISSYMPSDISTFSSVDNGCWVIDFPIRTLYKLDGDLIEVGDITGFSTPSHVVSTADKGCYVVDDGVERIYKIDSEISIEGFVDYSSLSPSISVGDIKRIRTDKNNNIWILANGYLYMVLYNNGQIVQSASVNVALETGKPDSQIIDFDLNRGNNYIGPYAYVIGGCSQDAFIVKYDINLEVIKLRENISQLSPCFIAVPQMANTEAIYVLGDLLAEPSSCTAYSSSSSSESSESSEEETSEKDYFYSSIYKLATSDLSDIDYMDLYMNNIICMTIPHVIDCSASSSNVISFSITGSSKNYVPYIYDEEFVVVVREKVDFRAMGPNASIIKGQGKDIGQENYINSYPNIIDGLIPGFEELRGKNA